MAEQGITLYGNAFNGAWSPGTSKRGDWFTSATKDFP